MAKKASSKKAAFGGKKATPFKKAAKTGKGSQTPDTAGGHMSTKGGPMSSQHNKHHPGIPQPKGSQMPAGVIHTGK